MYHNKKNKVFYSILDYIQNKCFKADEILNIKPHTNVKIKNVAESDSNWKTNFKNTLKKRF